MPEPLNADRLYQLLEDYEPAEIRNLYGEELKAHPECEALLREFEGLDDDFVQLGQRSSAPEPDWPRIRGEKKGILLQFQRFALPLAAVLILGIALTSQYWYQSFQSESKALDQVVLAEPSARPAEEKAVLQEGEVTLEPADPSISPEFHPEEPMAIEEDFSDVARTAPKKDSEQLERSNNPATSAAAAEVKRESNAQLEQFKAADDAEAIREPEPVFEPSREAVAGQSSVEPETVVVEMRKPQPSSIQAWQCWRDAALDFYNNPDSAPVPFLADGLNISWSLLDLEGRDHIAFYEALARLPAGSLKFQDPAVDGEAVIVTWFFLRGGQMKTGRLKLVVNQDCRVTQWQELD